MNMPEPAENKVEEPEATVLETDPQESTPSTPELDVNKLRIELEKFKDLALRCQAELDNYRKRIAREKEDAIRYANAALLERLLPVVDNFELGLEAAKNAAEPSGVLIGMNMVQKQLLDFLKDSGVQSIEATGSSFDPNLHEAVAHEHNNQTKDGHIIRQLRSGYKLRDRLLRPSIVVVSKGTADS